MDVISLETKARQLRADVVKMVHLAKSGHPGGSLSCVDILVALYYKHANIDPKKPNWEDRDRIILSKGHSCPALYAVLADKGYIDKNLLWTLRKTNSSLQGHPDMKKTPGVDLNTGSLGQGVSVAMGMALGAKHQNKNYKVFAIIGDGESQEGLTWEAAMAAAHYKLDNFTVILDHNGLQIDGSNDKVMSIGNMVEKYRAFGFETLIDFTLVSVGFSLTSCSPANVSASIPFNFLNASNSDSVNSTSSGFGVGSSFGSSPNNTSSKSSFGFTKAASYASNAELIV